MAVASFLTSVLADIYPQEHNSIDETPSTISWFPWSVEPKACSLKLRLNGPCICGKMICRKPSWYSAALVHLTREIALDWAPPHIPTSFYRVTWSTVTLGFYYGPFRRLTDPTYSWPRPVTLSLPLGYDTPLGYMQREIALDQVQPHIPPHFYRVAWSTVTLGFYY